MSMSGETRVVLGWLLLQAAARAVWAGGWSAVVVQEIDALVTSCVVIPCSFSHKDGLSSSALRGSWFLARDAGQNVFDEDDDDVGDNFRGRTSLTGRLREGNCSLTIVQLKEHDDGPFCFRVSMNNDEVAFTDRCARLNMLADPPEPKLSFQKKRAVEGEPYTVTCSVAYTCTAHPPVLTWSRHQARAMQIHKDNGKGAWELVSVLSFLPDEKTDDGSEINCTATFSGGRSSWATLQFFVKHKERYLHIILPLVVGLGVAVVFGALYVLMKTKYKNRIADLQNGRNGRVWGRISRISQRLSSSRFVSSRPTREPVDLSAYDTPSNLLPSTAKKQKKFSKPRCPSPKSQPRAYSNRGASDHCAGYGGSCDDDDYTNTADLNLNIYGNL